MRITIGQYYAGFAGAWGLVAGVPFIPPLLNSILRYFWPAFAAYLYPPLGHVQPIALAGTLTFLLMVTLVVFTACRSAQQVRPYVSVVLACLMLAGMCFFIGLYSSYVRRAPIRAEGAEVPLSVGYERTDFAKQLYAQETDAEMLHDWGSSEEEIQKLWTKRSMAIIRAALWLSYTLILACVVGVVSVAVYQHAVEEAAAPVASGTGAIQGSGTTGP
jgi:hypothetical protein